MRPFRGKNKQRCHPIKKQKFILKKKKKKKKKKKSERE
jgi:hypothetical protein